MRRRQLVERGGLAITGPGVASQKRFWWARLIAITPRLVQDIKAALYSHLLGPYIEPPDPTIHSFFGIHRLYCTRHKDPSCQHLYKHPASCTHP
jgi:hypothetical protein